MNKVDKAFIDDIFGIPQNGSNIGDDDEAYSGKGDLKVVVPFEEKVSELNTEIAKAVSSIPTVVVRETIPVAQEKAPEKSQTKKESVTTPAKKEDVEIVAKSAIPADPQTTTSMFGDIFGEAVKVEKKEPKKEEEGGAAMPAPVAPKNPPTLAVAKEAKELEPEKRVAVQKAIELIQNPLPPEKALEKEELKVKTTVATIPEKTVQADDLGTAQMQPSRISAPFVIAGKATQHKWQLDSPAAKYNSFYDAKRDALVGSLLKGGELPFDLYYSELEGANVDVSVGEQFNPELVCQKMAECQKHRERLKQIQLRANRQFFQWERHMDLFGGLLARLEEIRGVEKRDGIRYEHMYDMESYFGELKSLHKSIDNVMRVLDSAFECLSRQVTVTLPIKDVERFNTGPKPMSPTLQRYDGLKTQANSSNSLATAKPKEAGTPAEPTPTKSGWDL